MTAVDARCMARALQLAKLGWYTTDPNPRVGCVITRQGEVVGEGWHRKAGEAHAERLALAAAGPRARGATVYVTLEPCSHVGRTPPCADALVAAGVTRVVAAMEDPNPLVAGEGLRRLQAAGIEVTCGVLEDAARALNPGFAKRMASGRPFVRCKLAMSLDGRTAMASGESQWITGPDARRDVQLLRARSSAIVTSIATVLADDPSLNVRLGASDLTGVETDADIRQPVRVVLDSRLRTPIQSQLLKLRGAIWIVTTHERAASADGARLRLVGAKVISAPGDDRIDLPSLFKLLADRGMNEILLETGPTLAGSALSAGLIDELILYVAPSVMGDGARGLFHLPALHRIEDRIEFEWIDVRQVGGDMRVTARPKHVALDLDTEK